MASPIKQNDWFRHFFDEAPRLKDRIVLDYKTPHQRILVIDTYTFGRCLILDDELQSSEYDEHLYHQGLVGPVFNEMNYDEKDVLIIGGGEGATLREVLKKGNIRNVTMVDIDKEVIRVSRQFLPSWHKNAFDDKRVQIIYANAFNFLSLQEASWNVIIMDLPSPSADNAIKPLYGLKFMKILYDHLKPDGWLVTQAGPIHPFYLDPFHQIQDNMKAFFSTVKYNGVFIPSFGMPWAFVRGRK